MAEAADTEQIEQSIDMMYNAFIRLDKEPDNEALKDWCENVCQPEHSYIDGFVANFIDFVEDKDFARKILKLLK